MYERFVRIVFNKKEQCAAGRAAPSAPAQSLAWDMLYKHMICLYNIIYSIICIYIYIYRERERKREVYIYIYRERERYRYRYRYIICIWLYVYI